MLRRKNTVVSMLIILGIGAALLLAAGRPSAAETGGGSGLTFHAGEPVEAGLSQPVTALPVSQPPVLYREINPLRNPMQFQDGMGLKGSNTTIRDPLAQLNDLNSGETPGLLFDFEGLGTDGFAPPDTVGDVGPNHYIQMVNVSFAVFDKSGNMLTGPTPFNALFSGFGGVCQTENDGDPIVVYDPLADRWLLSQFADIFNSMVQCIAVSTSADPTSTYYLYAFPLPDIPDYPKFGVWPDGYYMGTNSGSPNAYYAHVFDRVSMLAGDPAASQSFGGYPNFLMPADIDGPTGPAANTPGIFYTFLKDGYPNHPPGVDRIEVYEFDVDWGNPGNSTFGSVDTIPIAPYNYTVCGFFVQNCVPQPGTAQGIDTLSYWPMFRLAYRNLGAYEAMVGNFTVDLDGSDKAAIRWFELRNSVAGWELHQEGTYAPDGDHRWMGSIAMDGSGNIALGYSVSSPTTNPAIRYATRLVTDPAGTLQAEESIIEGGGVQTGIVRWGDYSAMSVDPADECTFWFTSEYHDVNDTGFNWNTRVGVFKEPTCTGALGPDFTIETTPVSQDICAPNDAEFTIDIGSVMGYNDPVTLSAQGTPAGTSTSFVPNPVVPAGSSTMTIGNTGTASVGDYGIDIVGIAPTSTHTSTVTLGLFDATPGTPTLLTPGNGATDVDLKPTYTWTAVSQGSGYTLEVATDAGFTNIVYSVSGLSGTSHAPTAPLDPLTGYHFRVRSDNVCGTGSNSAVFSFTTSDIPPILLVDDDDGSPDVQSAWTDALDTVGADYDIWETGAGNIEPDLATISLYETVLWFSGDRFDGPPSGPAGPSAASETALGTWLDGGGCLFISSQDYHYDKGTVTSFMSNYLGVNNITDDNGNYTSVTGQNVFAGLGSYTLTFPYVDFTDPITAGNGGLAAMLGNNGNLGGVTKDAGVYKTSLWTFGLEALPAGGRIATLGALIDWCGVTTPVSDIVVDPESLYGTYPAGTSGAVALSIHNAGEATLDWTIVEDADAPVGGGWADDFDGYATAANLHGMGGWKGWDNDPSFTAFTTSAQDRSAPNSVDIKGNADLVREFSGYTSGEWIFTAWSYIPGSFTGESYFILLNEYADGAGAGNNWSVQVVFNSANGQLVNEGGSGGTMTFKTDQWVEIRIVIDLTADTQSFYYDDQLLYTGSWTDEVSGGGSADLAAVDLFANAATSVYYDDFSLEQGAVPVCSAPDDIPWMSVSQYGGSTGAGDNTDLDVTLDAFGLSPGTHTGNLCISSNDPNEGLVIVPVEFEVTEPEDYEIFLPVILNEP